MSLELPRIAPAGGENGDRSRGLYPDPFDARTGKYSFRGRPRFEGGDGRPPAARWTKCRRPKDLGQAYWAAIVEGSKKQ